LETAGVKLLIDGYSTAISQVENFNKSLTSISAAATQAANGFKPLDAAIRQFGTAESTATQVANQFKAGMQGVSQAAGQLASAQGQTIQSANQFKAAQSSATQELSKLRSEQTQTAQASTQLKTAEGELATSFDKLKQTQIENAQASTQFKQAQTETASETTKLRTAQTEATQALTKFRTEQTQTAQAATQLKTVQTEAVQVATRYKTAQTESVQATTQLKTAQAGAVTELGKLRVAQTENVEAATQVKNAEVEETHAATQLKTAQAEATQTLVKLRSEQTLAIQSTTALKNANQLLDSQIKETRLAILQQSQAHLETAKSGEKFGSVTSLLNVKNTALAAGATLAAKSMINLAGDFDQTMAELQVATGITDRQSEAYKQLESTARQVGGSTKFSATEAAEGMTVLGQAGMKTNEVIEAIPAVAKAAAVNNIGMAEAATTATVALNSFGFSATEATRVIDVQTQAAATGILNFNDFGQAMSSVGSVAHQANQSFEETTSVLIALKNTGMQASDAGTSLKTALQHLQNPSKDARASMDELGLSVYDSSGKMRPFSDIIAQIETKTKSLLPVQKDQILNNIFQSDGIRAVYGAMGAQTEAMVDGTKQIVTGSAALKEWEKQLQNSAGATDKAAAILDQSFNSQLEKLTGNIQDAAIGIGQKLLPQLSGIVQGASKIIDKIQGFEESTHILSTMTSIGFKPLELAINAVLFVMDKLGEAIKFAEPYAALLGATIETKVLPPLKTLADIARTPFDLIDQGA
jgi:TP901 family phage tail tape measure protein